MKIGNLVEVIPSSKVSGYGAIEVLRVLYKVGIIVNEEVYAGIIYYIVLVEETLLSIVEYNLRSL